MVIEGYSEVRINPPREPEYRSGFSHVVTLPLALGQITGLRVTEDGALVASSESGIDYVVPESVLRRASEP